MDSRISSLLHIIFFDSKPLILKPWTVHMDMEKEEVKFVPMWIQLRLNFKYWGEKICLRLSVKWRDPLRGIMLQLVEINCNMIGSWLKFQCLGVCLIKHPS